MLSLPIPTFFDFGSYYAIKIWENREQRNVKPGDVIHIRREQFHAIRAITDLYIIEVQSGDRLTEDDITRYPYTWE